MKIAIYGGSFDPVHEGHTGAIEHLAWLFDKVIVLPAGHSPSKSGASASNKQRLEMLQKALSIDTGAEILKKIEIDTQELERPGPSYSIYTVQNTKEKYPDAEIYLCVGQDKIKSLHKWHKWDELKSLCKFVIFRRTNYLVSAHMSTFSKEYISCFDDWESEHSTSTDQERIDSIFNVVDSDVRSKMGAIGLVYNKSDLEKYDFCVLRRSFPAISSTAVRVASHTETVQLWLPCDFWSDNDVREETKFVVNDYIIKNNLYSEYNHLNNALHNSIYHLSEDRISHIERAILNASILASIHGADIKKVVTAMYLHDIAKSLSVERLKALGVNDVDLAEIAKLPASIQHSLGGVYIAQMHFDIQDNEILDAIKYHTTGRPDMTDIEMIVYLADATEYGRLDELSEKGIDISPILKIAKTAFDDANLKLAMRLALQDSVASLKARNMSIHPMTLEALEYYESIEEIL